VSATAFVPRPIHSPQELQQAMGTPYAVSEQQWAAISAPLSPSVVIAGAGSGKTTLMAARVVYLVVTGQVRPEEVLGLTFTTKAAAELRSRIREALDDAGVFDPSAEQILEPTVATYNAYAANLITEQGLRIGHEPDTRVITDASRYQLGARAVERSTAEINLLSDHPPTVIQNLLALDGAMSEHLVDPEAVRTFDAAERHGFVQALAQERMGKNRKTYRDPIEKAISAIDRRAELLELVAGYRRLKRDYGLMDFSDQIALAARLAGAHPEVGAVERARFKVVLLDEYQDTSVAQARMLAGLFSGPDAGTGRGHPVTAVGDPNQAIYGWRGASVSNIVHFGDTFPNADGTAVPVLPLTVNRRSDRAILGAANALAAPLYAQTGAVAPLAAKPGAEAGFVGVRVFETEADELIWLAEQVHDAHRREGEVAGSWAQIGVLTRDNRSAAACFDALTSAGVPVEIVGLSGLLRLPEVAEVVACLRLLHDVTDNAALLTLLTGPRWAIGPRDLKLLGARAVELAGGRTSREQAGLAEQLAAIANGVDPLEIAALSDALEDPGQGGYSAQARERFGLLAAELRMLRAGVGEPILDVVRRIVEVTGVDVELAAALSDAAEARRDNLDLFLKAVADFQAIDGEVTLAALLAYLTAEDDQGNGLDLATPTAADSVKLLTAHRAKGLEWAHVFVVGVCQTRFPSNQSRTLWNTSPAVLPAPLRGDADDLPQLHGYDKAAIEAYRADSRGHEAVEELRLAYVALTRAARRLWVTSHLWGQRATPYGPSCYQDAIRSIADEAVWLDRPERGAANPTLDGDEPPVWPPVGTGREVQLRRAAAELVAGATPSGPGSDPDTGLDAEQAALVASWDDELERLLAEARAARGGRIPVALPSSLSATAMIRLREDPEGFARDLARPMPRPPSAAARFGTRFHAWVETRFGQQQLIDPGELADRADSGIEDDTELQELIAGFEAGPFSERAPVAIEAPFTLVLAGQVVRGRIDAVYQEQRGFLVVDWKTSRTHDADPLQLALYRLAWAELHDVPLERVRAAFYYVRTGQLVEASDLPDRGALEDLLRDIAGGQ
jgi:DNA helicase-2/ATP-dependent DNA helicase PcrA